MKKIILLLLILVLPFGLLFSVNASSSPHGVVVHHVDNDVLQKAKDAGIKWIRSDIIWANVERSKGSYDWVQLDRIVNYADSNGLSMLFTIAYTPGWANDHKGIQYPADNVADWVNFVTTTINRYKSKVKYWSIWNEPNAKAFFAEGKDVFVQRVFLPAAAAIRSADPAAFIVGPETSHLLSGDAEWYFWMKYILTECAQYIDIVSHHIYKSEGAYYIYELLQEGETFIPAVTDIIEETGHGNKPFWITETGWNTKDFSEDMQGDRYLDMLTKRKEENFPNKVFFYEIMDDPAPGIDPWGILRFDKTEKPAYSVYKDFIAGKYDGNDTGGGDDDSNKNKCYSKKVSDSVGNDKGNILRTLRDFRDGLRKTSPQAAELIRSYYKFSPELIELTFKDSRLLKLGVDILDLSSDFLTLHGESYRTRSLPTEIADKLHQITDLLTQKDLSPPLRNFVYWGKTQLQFLKNAPIGHYLTHRLKQKGPKSGPGPQKQQQ